MLGKMLQSKVAQNVAEALDEESEIAVDLVEADLY